MRKIILGVCLLFLSHFASGQTAASRTSLDAEIDSGLASGTAISAATLRATLKDITASVFIPLTDGTVVFAATSYPDPSFVQTLAWSKIRGITGTVNSSTFLRSDGTWAIPAGGGGGGVTSVDVSGGSTGLTFTGGPITTSGTLTLGGTLGVANGGTGATTASAARTNLGLVIPASGDASSSQVVLGSDTRLTNTRTPTAGTVSDEIGFGVDGGGSVITAGTRIKRVVTYACTITGWGIVADQSGSVTMDMRKGTPSGGSVTTTTITASATPALSSQQVASSTTLTGWTTSVAAGDVLELVITGSPSSVTTANLTLKITR